MIKRRGKLRRGSPCWQRRSVGGVAGARLWQRERGQRWMLPLAVFLCVTGLVLLFAFSVEALAPFIYAIF